MTWLLLLLLGIDGSIHLGERPPGVLAEVVLRLPRLDIETLAATTDKLHAGAGWRIGQGVEVQVAGPLVLGGEWRHYQMGPGAKQTGWVRGGLVHGPHRVVGRWRVAGALPREGGAEWTYRVVRGRWAVSAHQGVLLYWQPDLRAGYAVGLTVGVRVR